MNCSAREDSCKRSFAAVPPSGTRPSTPASNRGEKVRVAIFSLMVACLATFAPAAFPRDVETVDRVVASIGNLAITETDVIEEYQFESFASGRHIPAQPPSAKLFRALESRLIDQKLLEQQLPNYPANPNSVREKAREELDSIRKEFKSTALFEAALHSAGLSEEEVLSRLETEQHILMMIDERTRPAAAVGPQDIQEYYRRTFLPRLTRTHTGRRPSLDQVQDRIREILVQQKMNQLLGEWLSELRTEWHVHILGS